jgi:uncharacterized protein YehS (DUF1456 family)
MQQLHRYKSNDIQVKKLKLAHAIKNKDWE